jgi:predicted  nucleic acid-binding Zn-ribbon protein
MDELTSLQHDMEMNNREMERRTDHLERELNAANKEIQEMEHAIRRLGEGLIEHQRLFAQFLEQHHKPMVEHFNQHRHEVPIRQSAFISSLPTKVGG